MSKFVKFAIGVVIAFNLLAIYISHPAPPVRHNPHVLPPSLWRPAGDIILDTPYEEACPSPKSRILVGILIKDGIVVIRDLPPFKLKHL